MNSGFALRVLAAVLAVGEFFAAPGRLSAEAVGSGSPFVPEGGAGTAVAPTDNAPLELRGIVSTKSGYIFGVYDPSKRQSFWVRQNDPNSDFIVRNHDVANDTITLDFQGRSLTLQLKAAKVESAGPVPNPAQVAVNRPGNNMPMPQPPAMTPTAAAEAARLEAVAAEVRRRRMMRQGAMPGPQTGQPIQPGQPPMPGPQPGIQPNMVPQPR